MKLRFLVLLGSVVACSETSSDDLDTNKITLAYHAERTGDSNAIHVSAYTSVDGDALTDVRLADSDSIWAISGADTVQLLRISGGGVYSADFGPGDHTHVAFELRRSSKPSALGSSADVPADLAFTPTPEGTVLSMADSLKLAWTNAGPAGTKITAFPDPCNGESTIVLNAPSDSGSWDIAAKDLIIGAPAAEGECIEVSLTRETPGVVDPALGPKSTSAGIRSLQKFKITLKP